MMQRFFAVLSLALLAFAAVARAAEPQPAAPVILNPHVVVEGAFVRLGDLFGGLAERGATSIARAPEPGKQVEVDARWLAAVAQAYGVPWRPSSHLDRSVIERTSQVIDSRRIEELLLDAMARRGAAGDLSIVLDNPSLRLVLPSDAPGSVAIAGLSHDPESGRFAAHLVAPAEGAPLARATVTGRAIAMTEVPVLRRRIEPGEVIGRDDVEWLSLRADRLGRNTVIDPSNLLGKSPRRALRPGEPVLGGELREPRLVSKNSLVTIRLETPRMVLTAQGRTLEAGASGEMIRVMNTNSNKVINAAVVDSGTVSVVPLTVTAAAKEPSR